MPPQKTKHEGDESTSDIGSGNGTFYQDVTGLDTSVTKKKKKKKHKQVLNDNTANIKEHEVEFSENRINAIDNSSPKSKKKKNKRYKSANKHEKEVEFISDESPKHKKKKKKRKLDENQIDEEYKNEAEAIVDLSPKKKKKFNESKTQLNDEHENKVELIDGVSPKHKKKKKKKKNKFNEHTTQIKEEHINDAETMADLSPRRKKNKSIDKTKLDEEFSKKLSDNEITSTDNMSTKKKKKKKNKHNDSLTEKVDSISSSSGKRNPDSSLHSLNGNVNLISSPNKHSKDSNAYALVETLSQSDKNKNSEISNASALEENKLQSNKNKDSEDSNASALEENLCQSNKTEKLEEDHPGFEEILFVTKEENSSMYENEGESFYESELPPEENEPKEEMPQNESRCNSAMSVQDIFMDQPCDSDATIYAPESGKGIPVDCTLDNPLSTKSDQSSSSSYDKASTSKTKKTKKKTAPKKSEPMETSFFPLNEFSSSDSEFEICLDKTIIDDSGDEGDNEDKKVFDRLSGFEITRDFQVHVEHTHEKRLALRGYTKEQKQIFEDLEMKTKAKFTPPEDDIIKNNWKRFSKIYNFEEHESYMFAKMCRNKKNVMSPPMFLKFAQFLGQGLPKRPLQSIFYRFSMLCAAEVTKKGWFNKKEDETIKKFMKDSPSQKKFHELSKILKRSRKSIYHRFNTLSSFENESAYGYNYILSDPGRVEENLKLIMEVSGCQTVEELYTIEINWSAIKQEHPSKTHILRNFWVLYLYTALRIKEPLCINEVEEKLIKILKNNKKISYLEEINWKELTKTHFPELHSIKLSRIFSLSKLRNNIPKNMKFKEMLEYLDQNVCRSINLSFVYPIITEPDGTVISATQVSQKEFEERRRLLDINYQVSIASSDED